ncbi:MAG: hypothetical protein HY080_08415 [Gammaproteobacteria bacterium]|nr:hypothetical protein [Gammaproteobacteria bacterium]
MIVGSLQLDSHPSLWSPQKHVYVKTTNLLDKIFGGKNYTVIGIVPKQGGVYQPQVLTKIKRIQAAIEQSPGAHPRAVGEGPHRRAEVMRFNQATKGIYI